MMATLQLVAALLLSLWLVPSDGQVTVEAVGTEVEITKGDLITLCKTSPKEHVEVCVRELYLRGRACGSGGVGWGGRERRGQAMGFLPSGGVIGGGQFVEGRSGRIRSPQSSSPEGVECAPRSRALPTNPSAAPHGLSHACCNALPQAVRARIAEGAAVNDPDLSVQGQLYTPLHWAAVNGHVQIATLLLEAGANVSATRHTPPPRPPRPGRRLTGFGRRSSTTSTKGCSRRCSTPPRTANPPWCAPPSPSDAHTGSTRAIVLMDSLCLSFFSSVP